MLEWASNPAFRSKNVRRLRMKALQNKSIAEHVPDGVFHEDFTETKDGTQKLIFSCCSLYEACKELLCNVRFAGSQYIQADVCYDGLGKRKLGALNRGEMYVLPKEGWFTRFPRPCIPRQRLNCFVQENGRTFNHK